MASLYEMAQGPAFDPVESFYAGRNARAQDKFNQNKLAELARADQARPLMGKALMGDTGSLNALAGLDPNAYMDVANMQSKQQAAQRELNDAEKQQIAGALYAADTPEKWAATINWLKQQGHDVEPQAMNFANRDALMGLSLGPSGMQKADQFNRGFGLDQFNAQTSRMNAEKAAQQDAGGIKAPAGFRWTQDGNLEAIKGGPQDPTRPMPNKTLRPTTDQNNAAGFFDRMTEAEKTLAAPDVAAAAQDYVGKAKANLPFGAGNYLATPEYQRFDQAKRDFINAQLRKESGAAISQGEFDSAERQYFPQPGDGPEVLAQKVRNRATAIAAMKRTAAGALLQGQPEQAFQGYPGADGITSQDIGGGGFNVGGVDIPGAAVEQLAADPSPEMRAFFDEEFGAGAAEQILGQ